jgi:hypothetical protein
MLPNLESLLPYHFLLLTSQVSDSQRSVTVFSQYSNTHLERVKHEDVEFCQIQYLRYYGRVGAPR